MNCIKERVLPGMAKNNFVLEHVPEAPNNQLHNGKGGDNYTLFSACSTQYTALQHQSVSVCVLCVCCVGVCVVCLLCVLCVCARARTCVCRSTEQNMEGICILYIWYIFERKSDGCRFEAT